MPDDATPDDAEIPGAAMAVTALIERNADDTLRYLTLNADGTTPTTLDGWANLLVGLRDLFTAEHIPGRDVDGVYVLTHISPDDPTAPDGLAGAIVLSRRGGPDDAPFTGRPQPEDLPGWHLDRTTVLGILHIAAQQGVIMAGMSREDLPEDADARDEAARNILAHQQRETENVLSFYLVLPGTPGNPRSRNPAKRTTRPDRAVVVAVTEQGGEVRLRDLWDDAAEDDFFTPFRRAFT